MDHVGGLPYYFSQRMFQKMGAGTCVCHPALAGPIDTMMRSWVALEGQQTPFTIIPLEPDAQIEVKNNIFLRAVEVSHAAGSQAYAMVERRSKLRSEYLDLPQERLRQLKSEGVQITRTLEIPLVAYTGDTEFGPSLFRDEFTNAKIVICECTFFDPDHQSRAKVGKHLHLVDLAKLLEIWRADAVVLVHLSRRTNLVAARQLLASTVGDDQAARIHFLMDHRTNRQRYERQEVEMRV
jgi:ribonuclease Z